MKKYVNVKQKKREDAKIDITSRSLIKVALKGTTKETKDGDQRRPRQRRERDERERYLVRKI